MATAGHVQPFSLRWNSTSGRTGPRRATSRECLLSSRSRVRVAVGAQLNGYFSLLVSRSVPYDDLLPVGNHSFRTFGHAGRHPLTTCHGRDARNITPAANRRSVLTVLRGSQTESQRRTGPYARAVHCSAGHSLSAEAPAACTVSLPNISILADGGQGPGGEHRLSVKQRRHRWAY